MLATLSSLCTRLFDRDAMLGRARQTRRAQGERALHPHDILLALVRCAVGDENRSVAPARRQFQDLTGFMPEESSFYDRLNPGFAALAWDMFLSTLARANRVQRREVARALGVRIRDVRVVDASVVTLPARAAADFPSTDSKHGGFKATATLSVLEDLLLIAHVTDARQHDRKAIDLPAETRGVLWLKDRGYSYHRLFAQIDDGGGLFIIRLKSSSVPTVTAIRSGLARQHLGKPFERDLPIHGIVDLDARFSVGRATRVFRLVGIPVAKNKRGDADWIWLATDLPVRVAAVTVGAFYRLRWAVENLFKVLKSVGRLDELRSGKPAIVRAFIAAPLIGLAFARPRCEPSLHSVFALLLANLASLRAAAAAHQLRAALERFIDAV